jgi:hypothetical protein
MRQILVILFLVGSAGCSGEKTPTRPTGDTRIPSGDAGGTGDSTPGDSTPGDVTPGDVSPGDTVTAGTLPSHIKGTSASGAASSTNFRARIRIGGPLPTGSATGSGKTIQGGTPESP